MIAVPGKIIDFEVNFLFCRHNILEQNEPNSERELCSFDYNSSAEELLWSSVEPKVSGDNVNSTLSRVFGSEAEDLGKLLTRNEKLSATDVKLFKDGKLKPLSTLRKKQKKNVNIMKKVSDILQLRGTDEILASAESQEFHTFTESEFTEWKKKLEATDSVGQLHAILKSINKAFPGAKFRGLKKCRIQMKRLKKTSRNIGKDRSTRKKENGKILSEGKKIMKCFLKKNNTKRDKC